MTFAGDLPSTVRFNNGTNLYTIDGGRKHLFTYATWTDYGQPAPGNLNAELDYLLPPGDPMSSVVQLHNTYDLYSVQSGKKRYIGGPVVYTSGGYNTKPTQQLTSYLFNSLPKGAPLLEPGLLVKTSDTNEAFVISQDGNSKHPVSPQALKSIDMSAYQETASILNLIPTSQSAPLTLLLKNPQGDLYLIDGIRKINLSSTQLQNLGKTANDFTLADSAFLSRLSTTTTSGELLVRINDSERVYQIDSGSMIHIQTGDDFSRLGYSFSNVLSLNLNTAALTLTNPYRSLLLEGTRFRVENTPSVYIFGQDKKSHLISTGYIFNNYNFSSQSVRQVTSNTLSFYPSGSPLSSIVETPDSAWWLISNGKRFWIPLELRDNYTSQINPRVEVPNSTLASISPTRNATAFIRIDYNPVIYYVEAGQKHALSQAKFASLGGTLDQVISLSSSSADSFKTGENMY
jgi:hypothetical protein